MNSIGYEILTELFSETKLKLNEFQLPYKQFQ